MVDRISCAIGSLAINRYGQPGPLPLILIHGGGQARHSWRRTAEKLAAQGLYSIAPDLRGHGDSDRAPDGDYRYDRLVEDIAAIIDNVGVPAVLVGASLGGKVALAAAGNLPKERIAGLVLVDAVPRSHVGGIARVAATLKTPDAGFASVEEAAERLAPNDGNPVTAAAIERLRRNMRQRSDGRWEWHWDPRFFQPEQELGILPALDYLETAARNLDVPTLLVRGDRSDVVDDEGAHALAAIVPQLEDMVIADAGHLVVNDQSDAFCVTLVDFLHRHFASLRRG